MQLIANCLRDDAAMAALHAEWAALWRRSTAAPFQHPAWALAWWAQFGNGTPRVATLRGDDGTLVGLLALYDLTSEAKTLPIGAGLSDYHDALVDAAAPADAIGILLATALQGSDLPCHLTDLPPDAALRRTRAPHGWIATEHAPQPCPGRRPGEVPALQRRKLRMARRRAARIGGCEVIADDPGLFANLVRLHGDRWRERGEDGVLADPRVLAFHEAALPELARAGLLRLRGLRFAGSVVAVIYALQSIGRVLFYLSGFDAAHSFESPGTILLGAMIDEAAAEGLPELHFLRGAEPYKYAWGATDRHNVTRILERA